MDLIAKRMETLSPARQAWRRAMHDPALCDLPYKIETNEHGQLVMSPVAVIHGRRQFEIGVLLREHVGEPGFVAVEIGIETPMGVKSPDVIWMSEARRKHLHEHADVAEPVPEICVEVLSPSNTKAEIDEKRDLYLARGVEEVWICDVEGRMRFFGASGEMPQSRRAPGFPERIA